MQLLKKIVVFFSCIWSCIDSSPSSFHSIWSANRDLGPTYDHGNDDKLPFLTLGFDFSKITIIFTSHALEWNQLDAINPKLGGYIN